MQLDNRARFLGAPRRAARAVRTRSKRSPLTFFVTLLLIQTLGERIGHAEESRPFVPHASLTFKDLVESIRHSPSVVAAKREVEMREADLAQSLLWSNPVIDATWSTIPVGRTNPAGLERPLAKVPSYHVGISYTFPLGKRGPLRAARAEDVLAARAQRCATGRQLALELAQALGNMATAQLRIEALRQLVEADHGRAGVSELKSHVARRGVSLVPFYDRTELVDKTFETASRNLIEGRDSRRGRALRVHTRSARGSHRRDADPACDCVYLSCNSMRKRPSVPDELAPSPSTVGWCGASSSSSAGSTGGALPESAWIGFAWAVAGVPCGGKPCVGRFAGGALGPAV